ncbi:MAG: hypothetical protein ABR562_08035, partial [Thermoplasmatota archaeon]
MRRNRPWRLALPLVVLFLMAPHAAADPTTVEPVDGAVATVEATLNSTLNPPGNGTNPGNGTTPPGNGTQPPVSNETTPPTDGNGTPPTDDETTPPSDNETTPAPDEWLRRLGTLPLMYQPGERWLYNTGS